MRITESQLKKIISGVIRTTHRYLNEQYTAAWAEDWLSYRTADQRQWAQDVMSAYTSSGGDINAVPGDLIKKGGEKNYCRHPVGNVLVALGMSEKDWKILERKAEWAFAAMISDQGTPCDRCGKNFPAEELTDVEAFGQFSGPNLCPRCLEKYEKRKTALRVPDEKIKEELIGYIQENDEISGAVAKEIVRSLKKMDSEFLMPPRVDEVFRGLIIDMENLRSMKLPAKSWQPGKVYTFEGSFRVRCDRSVQSWTTSKAVAANFADWRSPPAGAAAVIWSASTSDAANKNKFLDINPLYQEFGLSVGYAKVDENEVLAVPGSSLIRAQKIWVKIGGAGENTSMLPPDDD